jgi:hypothetical protein
LATVEPLAAPSMLDNVLETIEISDDYNIILTTRPRTAIPAHLQACSYFIFIGSRA